MYGIATGIDTVEHLVEQQQAGLQNPACVNKGAANNEFLRDVYPTLRMVEIQGTDDHILQAFRDGLCELFIFEYPAATEFVHTRWSNNECLIDGKPIGIIGEPMEFGPNYYGIGMRNDIPQDVVTTIDYWLTILMTCNPFEEEGLCQGDSLVSLYNDAFETGEDSKGSPGQECGYVSYPQQHYNKRLLPPWAIAVIVTVAFGMLIVLVVLFYFYKLREQRHRIRKRFVMQIALNIEIGPSPGMIPADKLVEEVQHIGGEHGFITKQDLAKWINDVKMTFISTKDFDAVMVAVIVTVAFGLLIVLVVLFYFYKLREQRHRIRKRFVWQIARNIEIGPSPGMIPADKLVEEVQHIGGAHGFITKQDLAKWINDVKMTFISTKDFDALWAAMDVDGTGVVDPIEFFVFLSSCGPAFEEVYNEQQSLPKIERLKLAARRLTNLRELGEEGVRRTENSIERSARQAVRLYGSSGSSTLGRAAAKTNGSSTDWGTAANRQKKDRFYGDER
eukprot:CAMPEP_0194067814 /NCGR_PEP_ID=MMETSP0009_2-20130614/86754_1 /TAXON_ID=210454 /ORGANISM="Grammatophora oceanica, Strain CCMP 410" /LENGTH=503 /DNA_ID=CAMNT_0038720857 /DNA_START=183 /DNA_END=1692 /DNA_ORIENTATION=-